MARSIHVRSYRRNGKRVRAYTRGRTHRYLKSRFTRDVMNYRAQDDIANALVEIAKVRKEAVGAFPRLPPPRLRQQGAQAGTWRLRKAPILMRINRSRPPGYKLPNYGHGR